MEQNYQGQKIRQIKPIPSTPTKIQFLYSEVIQKNFNIIDELLRKLSIMINRQDQIESQLGTFIKRLSKLQSDLQSIHNEHRRDNLHIVSNITGIRTEIVGIDTHIKLLFDEVKHKGYSSFLKKQPKERNQKKRISIIGSLNSSTHKISQNPSLISFEEDLIHQIDSQSGKSQQNEQRNNPTLEIKPIINTKSRDLIQQETKSINTKKRQKTKIDIKTEKEIINARSQLLDIEKGKQRNSQLVFSKIGRHEILYTKKNKSNGQIEVSVQPKAEQIVAKLKKHKTKINSIFRSEHFRNSSDMRQQIFQLIDEIIDEDSQLKGKMSSQEEKQEIYEMLYERLSSQELGITQFNNQSSNSPRVNQIFEQKLLEYESKLSLLKTYILQELTEQLNTMERERRQQKQEEKVRQNLIWEQLNQIKDRCKQFVTQQSLSNQTFKILQRNQQKWEDSYLIFANKQQTIKAVSYISNKISNVLNKFNEKFTELQNVPRAKEPSANGQTYSIHMKSDEQVMKSEIQSKILYWRNRRKNKQRDGRSTAPTGKSIGHTITIKQIKPGQLKKKTLQVLRNHTVRNETSKSLFSH